MHGAPIDPDYFTLQMTFVLGGTTRAHLELGSKWWLSSQGFSSFWMCCPKRPQLGRARLDQDQSKP
jgi:hypothetical protein